jgi:hypothetical protein
MFVPTGQGERALKLRSTLVSFIYIDVRRGGTKWSREETIVSRASHMGDDLAARLCPLQ